MNYESIGCFTWDNGVDRHKAHEKQLKTYLQDPIKLCCANISIEHAWYWLRVCWSLKDSNQMKIAWYELWHLKNLVQGVSFSALSDFYDFLWFNQLDDLFCRCFETSTISTAIIEIHLMDAFLWEYCFWPDWFSPYLFRFRLSVSINCLAVNTASGRKLKQLVQLFITVIFGPTRRSNFTRPRTNSIRKI